MSSTSEKVQKTLGISAENAFKGGAQRRLATYSPYRKYGRRYEAELIKEWGQEIEKDVRPNFQPAQPSLLKEVRGEPSRSGSSVTTSYVIER
jgi:hypothetical protein